MEMKRLTDDLNRIADARRDKDPDIAELARMVLEIAKAVEKLQRDAPVKSDYL